MRFTELQRQSLEIGGIPRNRFFVDLFPVINTSEDLINLADNEPAIVLYKPVAILNPQGKKGLVSKKTLTVLLCHGINTPEGHVTRSGLVDTEYVYTTTSKYLSVHNLPPIDMFFSCDGGSNRNKIRWDQKQSNPVIGVAGFDVYWRYDMRENQLVLDLSQLKALDNPLGFKHPKHNIIQELFTPLFIPKSKK